VRTLREWRVERLLSVRQLAEVSNVTAKTIVDIEHGRRRAHFATMRSICAALQVSPREVTEFASVLDERSKATD
jgi:transcriptional regulator with XRE-family HTH domain